MSDREHPQPRGASFGDVEARLRSILSSRTPECLGDLDAHVAGGTGAESVPAAVAVLLERVPGYNVILTLRTDQVAHHKGQISLAGGMRDAADPDLVTTALREAHEELGIEPRHLSVLGRLDDLVTVTGFRVTPIVAAMDAGHAFRPHPVEVERILRVPFDVLRDPSNWFDDVRTWRGRTYRLRSCRCGDDVIWGATSRILQHFLAVVPPDVL
ncbi:MAG: NUDIX hydrolase [Candidatus Krumholzibacteriia bacterium]